MGPDDGGPPLLGLLLRLANQRWGTELDAAFRDAGFDDVTSAHGIVMPFVPPEGASIGELARRAKVRRQTMAQSVERLLASGYVERSPDPHDARATVVRLGPKGRALRREAVEAGRRLEAAWARELGQDEFEAVRTGLQRLLGTIGHDPGEDA
jgi:DNA-binding MarR family transcriptional regulator